MPSRYQGNSKEVSALTTFIALSRALNSVNAGIKKTLRDANLSGSQFGILEALFHLGPLRQRELAEKLLVTGGNITMVVDNLEKRGLVSRKLDGSDRRCFLITLTKAGESLIRKIFPTHAQQLTQRMARLSTMEQKQLCELCKKLGSASK